MVSERPRALPKAAQQIQTQGLPLPPRSCLKTSWRRRPCELGSQAAEFGEGLIC